jgi:predicted acetyltransferase
MEAAAEHPQRRAVPLVFAEGEQGERIMVDIKLCASPDDLHAAIAPIGHYFGRQPFDEQVKTFQRVMPAHRVHVAWDNGRVVGAAGSYAFDLTIPGGRVPTAGVSIVAVLPTHRRRGILRQMMRAQLDACRERGEPLAYLWATEDTIYDRFGYGIASLSAEIDVTRDKSRFYKNTLSLAGATLLPLTEAEALIAPIYERVAAATPGMFARTSDWWQARILSDPQWRRGNAGELMCALLELHGAPSAYALYRLTPSFDRGVQTGTIHVAEAVGDSPAAIHAIWRYLLDIDWMARVTASILPVDHPLLLLVAEPRRLRFSLRDGVWIRLVDVAEALSARFYQPGSSVVIDVHDEFCRWNDGRWRVGADGVGRTENSPDLRCSVSVLGSAYLGGFSWTRLSQALRVEEFTPGAASRADEIFRTRSAPWCPEIF